MNFTGSITNKTTGEVFKCMNISLAGALTSSMALPSLDVAPNMLDQPRKY